MPQTGRCLFLKHCADNSVLNELLFNLFSKEVTSKIWPHCPWRTLKCLATPHMCPGANTSLPRTCDRPYISKTFVSYFEAWFAPSTYYKSTGHCSNCEACFTAALAELNKNKDDYFKKYDARKLKAWYFKKFLPLLAPPPLAAAAMLLLRVPLLWDRKGQGGTATLRMTQPFPLMRANMNKYC